MMKNFQDLEFADDYMFCRILQNHVDAAKQIVKLATGREVESIEYSSKQNVLDPYSDAKSVRFDIYFVGDSEVYDIEMQTTKQKNIAKRTRYYLGMSDVEMLKPGDDYSKLPSSFIVFICRFDPFGKGYLKYVSEERLFGIGKEIVDITEQAKFSADYQKVFLNAGKLTEAENGNLANFLNFVYDGKVSDDFTQKLANYVQETKQSAEEAHKYMTYQEHLKDSYNEGAKEAYFTVAKNLLEKGFPDEVIIEVSKVTLEDLKKIKEELAKEN